MSEALSLLWTFGAESHRRRFWNAPVVWLNRVPTSLRLRNSRQTSDFSEGPVLFPGMPSAFSQEGAIKGIVRGRSNE